MVTVDGRTQVAAAVRLVAEFQETIARNEYAQDADVGNVAAAWHKAVLAKRRFADWVAGLPEGRPEFARLAAVWPDGVPEDLAAGRGRLFAFLGWVGKIPEHADPEAWPLLLTMLVEQAELDAAARNDA